MAGQSIASGLIRLFTEFPCVGTGDPGFSVEMPEELGEASYALVVKSIEFRRRCMNQGFDNLLELLALHHAHQQKPKAPEEVTE